MYINQILQKSSKNLARLYDQILNGKTIFITHARHWTSRSYLERFLPIAEFRVTFYSRYFNQFGEVEEIKVYFDPKTGLYQGFTSITFTNPMSAGNALRQPHVIDGHLVPSFSTFSCTISLPTSYDIL